MLIPRSKTDGYTIKISSGFSLIELVIAISIIAIIAVMSVPSLQDYFANARLRAGADSLQGIINSATTETVKRSSDVQVVISSNKAQMQFNNGSGWVDISVVTFDNQVQVAPAGTLVFKPFRSVTGRPSDNTYKFTPISGSCPSGCPQVVVRANGTATTCIEGTVSGYNACN